MFETLKPLPPDAILGIMTLFRADPHAGKIDLSVGVYQDEQGRTPVLASVKRAEQAVLDKQDSKTYVAIAGNAGFNRGIEEVLYGKDHPALKAGRGRPGTPIRIRPITPGRCRAASLTLTRPPKEWPARMIGP